MSKRRSSLEKKVQAEIEIALGSEPDFLLLRNSIGAARYVNETDGKEYFVPYGLGDGSPDLVGILRVELAIDGRWENDRHIPIRVTVGQWLCLEVKPPEEKDATPEQQKIHAIWRGFGALVEVVHSVAEARSALERARKMFVRGGELS